MSHSSNRLLFLSLLGLACLNLHGATPSLAWRWSNPSPHGNNIVDMTVFDGDLVQITEKGQIYASSDRVTWSSVASGTTRSLRSLAVSGTRLVITGEAGTLLYGDVLDSLTVTNLPTQDWLEGVTTSGSLFVAVGDNGAIYTSPNGESWTRRSTSFTTWLRSVAYGASRFVTVGESGLIATSSNGMNWTPRTSGTTRNLNRIIWTGANFIVAGDEGTVLTSLDGSLWTSVRAGSTNALNAIAYGAATVVVAGDGEVRLRSATDLTWQNELAASKRYPAPNWLFHSAIFDGTSFFLGGHSGVLVEGFRTNTNGEMFWFPASESIRNWLWDAARVDGLFVAVGDYATLLTSRDGASWSLEVTPTAATNAIFLGVGGSTNLLVAVGNAGHIASSPNAYTNVVTTNTSGSTVVITTNSVSTFGIIWNVPSAPPTTNDLQGVANLGDQILVSGGTGTILTSTDGLQWTPRSTPTTAFLSGLANHRGGLVAVGERGVILTSPDGVSWNQRTSNTTNWLYRVRSCGDRLLAVGQNGTILISPDGIVWSKPASGVTLWLNDAAFVGDIWFVIGNQGTVLVSTNTSTWNSVGTITSKSLYGAATDGNRLVVVGYEGVILRSQVVSDLSPVSILGYSHTADTNSPGTFVDLFLAAGQIDQRFRVDISTNLLTWSTGPLLEITDSTGTVLFYQTSSNPPPRGYFRTRVQP